MPDPRTALQTVLVSWLALGLGAVVCAPSLLRTAEHMEDGPARDARLAVVRPLADLSAATGADRGWRWAELRLHPPVPAADDRFEGWAAGELVLPDGRVLSGAHAVLESLANGGRHRWMLRCYVRSRGFRHLTEAMYRFVARNRNWLPRP